ncbi:penicillin-insensitive murein endopeptidase [uncultured Paraglaciecola sp.]|uniref:penicillin-insensitive murein endopeptidase n=1 Tax=uncultured Paraglaciecola sp. TaxID=1765024 RepID=UPI002598A83A|nr:penicillin-insensitive murein endopeptidase [uncultured Paraglaciecola sp.]
MRKAVKFLVMGLSLFSYVASAEKSTCYGTTAKGRLENGVEVPSSGDNYVTYSRIASLAGRTHVHSEVRSILVGSYKSLSEILPSKIFKYAETGFAEGGPFKPHKTHRNGLSVDFMTPVVNELGQSVHLPTHVFNKFGYNIEFDNDGSYKNYSIDYIALAAHIVALHKAALAHGVNLWRVIFDPKLQPELFKTSYGPYLKKYIQFSKTPSWVRHDEHYHVDFDIPCKALP